MIVKVNTPSPTLELLAAFNVAEAPVPEDVVNSEAGLATHVAVAPGGKFCMEYVEFVVHNTFAPVTVGGLDGLNSCIVMVFDKAAVCVVHKFAFTVIAPALVPFGVKVIEFVVLVPVQPPGFVHV